MAGKTAVNLESKKRILFFSHYFFPEGNAPASRVHETCKRWVRSGHEVTVVTCAPNVPNGKVYEGYRNRFFQREIVDGINVIRVWTFIAPNKGFLLRVSNYFSYMFAAALCGIFLKRPDIIIATSPQFFCGWAGVITKWLKRRPLLLEIRDIWPESIGAVGAVRSQWLMKFLEWLERRMYAAATHIVTVGEGYRECLLERGIDETKISVVMNGVDYEIFQRDATAAREEAEALRKSLKLEGRFVVAYIGTIGMASGLDVVVRAAQRCKSPDADSPVFLLVGDGALLSGIQAKCDQTNLENVRITGRVPKEKVPAYLALADCILVHLKKAELFTTVLPSKMFEAMATGKPIILGVEGDAARLLQRSEAGVTVEPEDEKSLLEAIQSMRNAPHLGDKMGRFGQEYIRKHHDREKLSQDYLDIVCRISGCKSGKNEPKTVSAS